MTEYIHWCGNCQIRIYMQRHYGRTMNWVDCPYICEYKSSMKNSVYLQEGEEHGRTET